MIRCSECGYKNSPVYHYCGVCGAVLHPASKKEVAPAKPAAPAPPAAHSPTPPPPPAPSPTRASKSDLPVTAGMSFLGLSNSPSSSSPDYLLDDEDAERSVAWGRILLVLILVGAAGGLGWQYYRGGYPFAPQAAAPAAVAPATTATSAPEGTSTNSPSPASETPTPGATPAPAEPQTSVPAAASETTPPAEAKPETAAETKPTPAAESAKPEPAKNTEVATVVKKPPVRTKAPAPAPGPPMPPGESLFIQGQRYLYGTGGVQQNCDLALKSLTLAAARSHPRAQSTLGTMYSTGHCVPRDLPSAYKWFAKALHSDPNNTRLEQDLSVVWRQMTPGEKQLATQSD
jgi:Sel1 repeat